MQLRAQFPRLTQPMPEARPVAASPARPFVHVVIPPSPSPSAQPFVHVIIPPSPSLPSLPLSSSAASVHSGSSWISHLPSQVRSGATSVSPAASMQSSASSLQSAAYAGQGTPSELAPSEHDLTTHG
jgi:hypothetical protein